ncbi:hypothetical protein Y032_0034g2856 [Ancylostoma ceylanicum]|uniref:Peptidase M23 domain-containing protein n=2 Tax=Ancylostoma ceylanicum TaxID=53326 RepID=A0A016UMQ8_9BILA|nr:hypothetical protein Y032_0034g2856 [Ancylostoma ceylanicum]
MRGAAAGCHHLSFFLTATRREGGLYTAFILTRVISSDYNEVFRIQLLFFQDQLNGTVHFQQNNALINDGRSKKAWRYNGVRGWDIECRMMEDEDGGEKRAPLIYSPIAGELVGRTRLVFDQNGAYSGCDNDGMFIVGTGDWIGFEARLYNVKTREDLGFGRKRIVQGEPIGTRLECDSSPDSVFLEMRYQGRVVDISDVISAQKCQLPQLPDLFK